MITLTNKELEKMHRVTAIIRFGSRFSQPGVVHATDDKSIDWYKTKENKIVVMNGDQCEELEIHEFARKYFDIFKEKE